MKYLLKIVPDSEPNADGRWLKVTTDTPANWQGKWREAEAHFAPHIPEGEHLVQFATDD